ncbi:MAG: hypothetical protein L0177_00505, partial [Chloroflexi bacterium]|nr:hypothetical protein [Chloroflexota bacterium]
MVLRNFVVLETDQPAVMHFARGEVVERDITDPLTRQPKRVRVLEFLVDRLNGVQTEAVFSVTSEKLAQALFPFVESGQLSATNFIITK